MPIKTKKKEEDEDIPRVCKTFLAALQTLILTLNHHFWYKSHQHCHAYDYYTCFYISITTGGLSQGL